ncbi:MAG: hypothetical protein CMI02_19175 [Oceanospirillaceae bacterium]|nr:hypothetical protein [Oceanospirillaceae bacterium]MBT14151.1 hypothetical protein [Oceanospirillaceae bacterium]|tara:strand:- start:45109 stop:46101 length:993 start_codon:yes stop_codon:yes gene_type:complete
MTRWLLLPLLVSVAALASAEGSARDWLDQMKRAFKEENYRGVLIYGNQQHWETISVVHGKINGVEHEKLRHLTGIPREIIRSGDQTTCIHPGDHSVRIASSLPSPLQGIDSNADISVSYDFRVADTQRIAGRYARQMIIAPKDRNRYGYRLWLDQESGLLLRSDMLGQDGEVLERFQFASVDIGMPLTQDDFVPGSDGHPLSEHPAPAVSGKTSESPAWLPEWVPTGFVLMQAGELSPPGEQISSEESLQQPLRLMYTDGLAAFTLFVDLAGSEKMPEMVSQWGATSAAVRYRSFDESRYRITAVGELPSAAISRIAGSVTPRQTVDPQH